MWYVERSSSNHKIIFSTYMYTPNLFPRHRLFPIFNPMPFRKSTRRPSRRPGRRPSRRPRRRRGGPFVRPQRRLSGVSKMPFVSLSRCYDGSDIILSSTTHTAPGYWQFPDFMNANGIPGIATLKDTFRYFRIKSVTVQYTPSFRSDEYSKLFVVPSGTPPTQTMFDSNGGCLEIKQLRDWGHLAAADVATWQDCLNKAGKLRRCASTKPFSRRVYPKIVQQLNDDDPGTPDAQRLIKAPWLSTQVAANLSEIHHIAHDAFHSMNNLSYDQSRPLRINRRYVFEVQFKGLMI